MQRCGCSSWYFRIRCSCFWWRRVACMSPIGSLLILLVSCFGIWRRVGFWFLSVGFQLFQLIFGFFCCFVLACLGMRFFLVASVQLLVIWLLCPIWLRRMVALSRFSGGSMMELGFFWSSWSCWFSVWSSLMGVQLVLGIQILFDVAWGQLAGSRLVKQALRSENQRRRFL